MVFKNLWKCVYKCRFTWVTRLSVQWASVSYLWTRERRRKQSIENWWGRNHSHFVLGLETLDGEWYKEAHYCFKFTISTSFRRFPCRCCSILRSTASQQSDLGSWIHVTQPCRCWKIRTLNILHGTEFPSHVKNKFSRDLLYICILPVKLH